MAWIAGHEATTASRASLYAALSGTRLPKKETVGTLLRWWAGNPADEQWSSDDLLYAEPAWAWIGWLPADHEGRTLAVQWKDRYTRLVQKVESGRQFTPRAPRVSIAPPPEQQRVIDELKRLLGMTRLDDQLWLIFGSLTFRVESYLKGKTIPSDDMCWTIVERCKSFAPSLDYVRAGQRLLAAVEVARSARARDRRIARSHTSRTPMTEA
ncbi:hypothetical protein [Streptomyces sp. RB17]|uniref:hypothetical protein n=1 Tax=Streptomyces sp. RB17 TaxID=2585197 RepID=UPI0012968C52|nr:hypothetical protein [Streptomyces sp. RB17]